MSWKFQKKTWMVNLVEFPTKQKKECLKPSPLLRMGNIIKPSFQALMVQIY